MKTIVTKNLRRTVRILNDAKRVFHLTAVDKKIDPSSVDRFDEDKSPYDVLQDLLEKSTEARLVIYVSANLRFVPERVFWEIIVN